MALKTKNTALVLVDMQDKLFAAMRNNDALLDRLIRLVQGAKTLELPILWCEQMPEKLGPTVPALAEHLDGIDPIAKTSFACTGSKPFMKTLEGIFPKNILLAGIEAHVCVYQTAQELLDEGFRVQVVADAVSSRREQDLQIALGRMQSAGAQLTSVEMALLELLKTADAPLFKPILDIIK